MSKEDDFDWGALEEQMDDVIVPTDVVDTTTLTDQQLRIQFFETTEALRGLSEMVYPRTPRGRELHSHRAALKIILLQRGLM